MVVHLLFDKERIREWRGGRGIDMASTVIIVPNFCFGQYPKSFSNSPTVSVSSSVPLLTPSAVSQISAISSSSANSKYTHLLKLKHRSRASAEGIPSKLVEDSKFVPINADDPSFGPPALLLLGFELEEATKIQQLLKDLDGEFLKVIYCTKDMISQSLWEAMHTEQSNLEEVKIAKSLPRVCFLSGLSGEETMMFIDAFEETGLEPAVFAALVPNSAEKPLEELIEEIMGDHELLSAKQSGSA